MYVLKQMRIGFTLVLMVVIVSMLTGCLYPQEKRKERQGNPSEYISMVQGAIDHFREKTGGMLPIKNSEMDTPLYEKYKIDFKRLQERGLISNPPPNSYEGGGSFIYVLINVETKPEVKLLDLASYQSVIELQRQVQAYQKKNNGTLPLGEAIAPGIYHVNWDKMGVKKPDLKSPFNRQLEVSFMLEESGVASIYYGVELMKMIEMQSLQSGLEPNVDLRELLVKNSPFVPNQSLHYYWENNEPTPSLRAKS
ncbi:hypothetical protein NV379_06480 [Paenibacillus sp. N1-5-1-14]|uniref:hypothetical protein n=1 Tax=Paenibacillus radicibacter TaxID=2972488 RepID=UPI0021599C42|nr:hypothetical protein [Paenibacillus radicibacter]MCR8642303.1 hypothetical protein [Paenibacillus radicibacter]